MLKNQPNKISLPYLIVPLAVLAVIATLSAFFDLQVSKALYNPDLLFGHFFEKLGEFPFYFALCVGATLLFHNQFLKDTKVEKLFKVIFFLGALGGWFVVMMWVTNNFVNRPGLDKADYLDGILLYQITIAIVLNFITLFLTKNLDKKTVATLFWFAVLIILVFVVSNYSIKIIKTLWERVRFRSMMYLGQSDFAYFTPWYLPQFGQWDSAIVATVKAVDSNAFNSFPSGHTSAAANIFCLIMLPDLFECLKKRKWMFWVFPAVYTAVVGVSRIVVGAHYLSDILFGASVAFGLAVLFRHILLSVRQLLIRKNILLFEPKEQ